MELYIYTVLSGKSRGCNAPIDIALNQPLVDASFRQWNNYLISSDTRSSVEFVCQLSKIPFLERKMNSFPEVLPDLTEQKVLFPPIPVYDRRRQIFPEDYPRQKIQKNMWYFSDDGLMGRAG